MDARQGEWTEGLACRVTVAVKIEDIRLDAATLTEIKRGESGCTLHGGGEREAEWGGCCWMAPSGSVLRSWWSVWEGGLSASVPGA